MEVWITLIVVFLGIGLLWDRFRSSNIPERYLKVPGLETLCQEYLETIKRMNSGQFSVEELHELDSQRQWLHNEILRQLELDRDDGIDVIEFAKKYLGWS
jgi:hypothetical protein